MPIGRGAYCDTDRPVVDDRDALPQPRLRECPGELLAEVVTERGQLSNSSSVFMFCGPDQHDAW